MARLLRDRGEKSPTLLELMATRQPILVPGCYDALSARLVEEAGFAAVYMTGFGSSAAHLGRPDVGLLTMSEMVDNARRMVAIHLEDQLAPKRCGHLDGKQLIPAEEMAAKLRAAGEARSSPDFLLIARTDARAVEGLDTAIDRARRYREAGADVLFVEAPQSESEIRAVAAAFPGVPLLFNWAEGGKTPAVEHDLLAELGFAIVIFPISTLLAATGAMREVLARIRADGTPVRALGGLPRFGEFLDFIGLPEVRELEQRYQSASTEEKV